MDNVDKKEIFFNRAEVKEAERIYCDNCFENVVFLLKDNDHEFSIGLSTVLECLIFAIQQGELPKLPQSWLSCADIVCDTKFSFNEEFCYHDYCGVTAVEEKEDEVFQNKSREISSQISNNT